MRISLRTQAVPRPRFRTAGLTKQHSYRSWAENKIRNHNNTNTNPIPPLANEPHSTIFARNIACDEQKNHERPGLVEQQNSILSLKVLLFVMRDSILVQFPLSHKFHVFFFLMSISWAAALCHVILLLFPLEESGSRANLARR